MRFLELGVEEPSITSVELAGGLMSEVGETAPPALQSSD
jgi:hypothetical protein